ncbi:MAG: site-2 protease family protein [Planctomycetes bacterium]|nr:site-2 protease family protein [Planctomycetota bacterium]
MPDHVATKLLVLGIWFVSVYAHELGHAMAAYWGGDRAVRDRGGFSPIQIWFNNPWMGLVLPAIILMFTGFAFPGAATRVNRSSLRDSGVVSLVFLAGPAATLAITAALVGITFVLSPGLLRTALALSVFLNIMSFLLNLLPLPSLDGFGAIGAHLPGRVEHWMYRAAVPTMVLLVLLLFAVPQAAAKLTDACLRGATLVGIEQRDVIEGFQRFTVGLTR